MIFHLISPQHTVDWDSEGEFSGGKMNVKVYLNTDEICLTFIGNSLGQECFTTSRGTIEQDTTAGLHAKLQEFFWMFHWVLKVGKIHQ